MKTYPIFDKEHGPIDAFEIENAYVGVGTVADLLNKIVGVSDVRARKIFSKSGDIRVEFKYQGKDCVVVEPFGDNSRYWIGSQNSEGGTTDLGEVENAFKQYKPSFIRELLGDLLSLRIVSRLLGKA
jgi:hypothetical protein